MRLRCPRDASELVVRESEGHIGHACPTCKGIWLPYKFLESIKHSYEYSAESFLAELRAGQLQHSNLKCPECCGTLNCSRTNSFSLDRCESCRGVWFDQEELRTSLARLKKRPGPTSGVPEMAAAEVGFWALFSIFF